MLARVVVVTLLVTSQQLTVARAQSSSELPPMVRQISSAAMDSFLDNEFSDQFEPSLWRANWSPASDVLLSTRINTSQLVQMSTSAALSPFRQLAKAFTMVSALGAPALSKPTFQAVAGKAIETATGALASLTAEQSRIGLAQAVLSSANDLIETSATHLTGKVESLESVDKYDAATRANALTTQLETSYTLTGRISQLSLLKYL